MSDTFFVMHDGEILDQCANWPTAVTVGQRHATRLGCPVRVTGTGVRFPVAIKPLAAAA